MLILKLLFFLGSFNVVMMVMTTFRPAVPQQPDVPQQPVFPQGIGIPPGIPPGIGAGLPLPGPPPNIDVRRPFTTNTEFPLGSLARIFQNTKQLRSALFSTNTCSTPNHQCIHIKSCRYLDELFTVTDAATLGNELRNSFCGYDGFDILICCPSASSSMQLVNDVVDSNKYMPFSGYANDHGIIFSSITNTNSIQSPITRPLPKPINQIPQITNSIATLAPVATINVSNALDYEYFSPFSQSQSLAQLQQPPQQQKPQSSFSSAFTFAPLLALPSASTSTVSRPSPLPVLTTKPTVFPPIVVNPSPSSSTFSTETVQPPQNVLFGSKPPNQCGVSKYTTNSRVVGGAITQIGQYPWIAALAYRFPNTSFNELQFYCSGSLITRSHVLTSAHCVNDFLQLVRLGEYDLSKINDGASPIDFTIAQKIVHHEYLPSIILNDIAILKLSRQVPINDRIRPICLPLFEPLRSADLTGYSPYVAGWGSTFYQGPQSSILQETQVQVVSTQDCAKSYKQFFPTQIFDERIICAGSAGHDTCQGDSGGPLMLPQEFSGGDSGFYFVLVGLVSYGYECAKDGFPGVYTRIAAYLPWIQQNLS